MKLIEREDCRPACPCADGQLRFVGGIVQGDTDGNRGADLEIPVLNVVAMQETDFLL